MYKVKLENIRYFYLKTICFAGTVYILINIYNKIIKNINLTTLLEYLDTEILRLTIE